MIYNEIEELNIKTSKDKLVTDLKRLFKSNYNTLYDDKDQDGDAPSKNKLIFTDDNLTVEFSYYSTKVELTSNIPFNEILGISGTGFTCGYLNKDSLININEEYRQKIKPIKESFTTTFITSVDITDEMIQNIIKAEYTIYDMPITEIDNKMLYLQIIDRMLFFNIKVNKDLSCDVYKINEDSNLIKLVFKSIYETKNIRVDIKQSFIIWKQI